MELGGCGEGAAKRQVLSSSDAAAAAGEDQLSALPDDVLVLILLKLNTRAAAQTRVLSHRWRRIWALLPALRFTSAPEPHWLRDALDGHNVLLRGLWVDGATPESLAVWLPAAAPRVSGCLVLRTTGPVEELIVVSCFVKSQPIANISAPLLTKLQWWDKYDPSCVHLGKMPHLQWLGDLCYLVYGGIDGFLHPQSQSSLSLLQRFKAIKSIVLTLVYPRGIENYDYMMEYMTVLPDITFLDLRVRANGHAFGASTFHVLRLCTSIRRLKLDLPNTVSEAQDVCSSDCICVQRVEWETEELLLNHLEEVEFCGYRGTEHEVAFAKRLFDWGTELKEMRVNFHESVSEVNAKDLYQTFQIFSRPGVCMKFYRYENGLEVLYAPED